MPNWQSKSLGFTGPTAGLSIHQVPNLCLDTKWLGRCLLLDAPPTCVSDFHQTPFNIFRKGPWGPHYNYLYCTDLCHFSCHGSMKAATENNKKTMIMFVFLIYENSRQRQDLAHMHSFPILGGEKKKLSLWFLEHFDLIFSA